MVYTAQSRALAILEMLVHLDGPDLLNRFVVIEVEIDSSEILELDIARLPRNWTADPAPSKLRAIGDDWIATGASAVLRVPSVLVPGEFNFLLNPSHPKFPTLRQGKPTPFQFDARLSRR
jgi:RES domain-containing protein